jgi:hypothetical protein
VIDQSPTAETADVFERLREPWLRVLFQEDHGVANARNTGLRSVRGELVAFLDSDDEWLPHHLELMSAFFDAFPEESLATAEWAEPEGATGAALHPWVELSEWYPCEAARVGSARFTAAAPGGDPYLRVFSDGHPIGAWADPALAGKSAERPWHYRGNVFEDWRWGPLAALEATVLRRELVDALGLFDDTFLLASDFPWLARACERAPLNLLASPSTRKHQLTQRGRLPREGHLVSAKNAVTFHEEVLRAVRALYASRLPDDAELRALLGLRHHLAGEWAAFRGDRARALAHFEQALVSGASPELEAARARAEALPEGRWLSRVYRAMRGAVARAPEAEARRLDACEPDAPAPGRA